MKVEREVQQAEPPAEVSSVVAGLTPREPGPKGGDAEDERESSGQKNQPPTHTPLCSKANPRTETTRKRETKSSTHRNHATARHATMNPQD
ncbi:Hypothetical predicted protein [Pelobates cultripes]|uniref:Uncharacterized protein n=1 Tax=Pelobates cultripes TaxID=61616 RepID=A0AAD1W0Z1_PELCU|nr:Hypothetical predicted protein [Pelobates cultripes]